LICLFSVWHGTLPDWLPLGVGKISLFYAIFNVADMAISTGVGILIFFNKKRFIRLVLKNQIKKRPIQILNWSFLFYTWLHVWRFISIDFFACPG
jgi:hypothetical protein